MGIIRGPKCKLSVVHVLDVLYTRSSFLIIPWIVPQILNPHIPGASSGTHSSATHSAPSAPDSFCPSYGPSCLPTHSTTHCSGNPSNFELCLIKSSSLNKLISKNVFKSANIAHVPAHSSSLFCSACTHLRDSALYACYHYQHPCHAHYAPSCSPCHTYSSYVCW